MQEFREEERDNIVSDHSNIGKSPEKIWNFQKIVKKYTITKDFKNVGKCLRAF